MIKAGGLITGLSVSLARLRCFVDAFNLRLATPNVVVIVVVVSLPTTSSAREASLQEDFLQ